MMAVNTISLDGRAYVNLGEGPMHLWPQDAILIVAAPTQPPPHELGHWLHAANEHFISMGGPIWARALAEPCNAVVRTEDLGMLLRRPMATGIVRQNAIRRRTPSSRSAALW